MQISKHITYFEATHSPTAKRMGIENVPTDDELENMRLVAEKCFEPLREWYVKPIRINSFFRCHRLNQAVGSKDTSYHRLGMAIDMSAGTKAENAKLFIWCKDNLRFTELVNEYDFSWVHIAYDPNRLIQQIKTIV